jgi:hypothetical protein
MGSPHLAGVDQDCLLLKAGFKINLNSGLFEKYPAYELVQYIFGTKVCVCIAERL